MKISYNWLKEYINLTLTPEQLAEKISLAGLEVEEMQETGFKTENVFVGKVITCEQHPNADKLHLCTVDYGREEPVQVICGAPNVAQGQKIPFAAVGAALPNGIKIKKAKLRGVESYGMICSQAELEISDDHSGIWVLPEDAPVGAPLKEYLQNESDVIFDISVTPNRPDCLSHLGVAREIAALTGEKLLVPQPKVKEDSRDVNELIKITVEAEDGCPRYAARVIENVKIAESPQWLKDKLNAVGIRSINNIVDITNFVLMETGHPLHAFDLDTLAGKQIVVRYAKKGEKFVTLDGVERELPEKSVMICDKEKPVAIGGIMGGENSEVTSGSTSILLESAYFNPVRINKTSKFLKLFTEASHRFERGADPNGVEYAMERAVELMQELAGGTVLKGMVDVYPRPVLPNEIPVDLKMINKIIGMTFTLEQVKNLLAPLGIKVENGRFIVPTYRPDVERTADIAEEVARIYGYDNVPQRDVTEINYGVTTNEFDDFVDELKILLSGMGMYEAVTNSMGRKELFEKITGMKTVDIVNPVSGDLTALRNSLVPSILEVLRNNINRRNTDLRMFEINNIFFPDENGKELPKQEMHLCVAMTGRRYPLHWDVPSESVDFFDIKGVAEEIMDKIFLDNYELFYYDNFISGRENLGIKLNNGIAGFIVGVDDKILKEFDINQKVFILDLNLEKLFSALTIEKKYIPIPRFPGTERDMALILKRNQAVKEIEEFINKIGGKYLTDIIIFDRYLGKSLAEDEQSLAFKLVFRADNKTLTDKEVNKTFNNIIKQVTEKFNAKLRT